MWRKPSLVIQVQGNHLQGRLAMWQEVSVGAGQELSTLPSWQLFTAVYRPHVIRQTDDTARQVQLHLAECQGLVIITWSVSRGIPFLFYSSRRSFVEFPLSMLSCGKMDYIRTTCQGLHHKDFSLQHGATPHGTGGETGEGQHGTGHGPSTCSFTFKTPRLL